MAWDRTYENTPGRVYDPDDPYNLYGEDINEIIGLLKEHASRHGSGGEDPLNKEFYFDCAYGILDHSNPPEIADEIQLANGVIIQPALFDPDTVEIEQFRTTAPSSIASALQMRFQFNWRPTTGSGAVCMLMQALAVQDNDNPAQALGSWASSTDTLQTFNYIHTSPWSGWVDIPNFAPNRPIWLRLARYATDPSDTLAVDAPILSVHGQIGVIP